MIDVNVWMKDPQDFDFSPRATLSNKTVVINNDGQHDHPSSIDLNEDQFLVAERDRMLELRVKFSVDGMHGVLTHRTKNIRDGPNSKTFDALLINLNFFSNSSSLNAALFI